MPNDRPPNLEPPARPAHVSAAQLDKLTRSAMHIEHLRFVGSLPTDVVWSTDCALYTRESDPNSLVGDAAVHQLRIGLELMAAMGAVPPWENVYFENLSATEVATRLAFQELLERAMAGEFRLIGAYMSHRLFRNADEASAVKKQLRRRGVQLIWTGKPVGLDDRDPNLWLMERNADTQDEWHSRQTGWLVGRQLEFKTRKGEPIGHLPECWRVVDWAPSNRPGQVGRPIKWELAEPMATIVRQGAAKYLDGSSFREIAIWSEGTALAGVTPAKRAMDWVWWNQLLKNPKLAGMHRATRYAGFKPGKEFLSNAEQGIKRDLVPCFLPPLITLEEHLEILARGMKLHRSHGAPSRVGHGAEILSGIAYDMRCGHEMHIGRHEGGDYLMRCAERGFKPHGSSFPSRHAGEQLADLVGAVEFDETFVAGVVAALAGRAGEEVAVRAVADPAAVRLQAAIAAIRDDADLVDLRRSLESRLHTVEARTAPTAASQKSRQAIFRAAVTSLERWRETWAEASPADKNRVLRAAGVQAFIEPVPHRNWGRRKVPGPRSRLVEVRASSPEFALALYMGSQRMASTSGITGRADPPTNYPRVVLPSEYMEFVNVDHQPRARPSEHPLSGGLAERAMDIEEAA